MAKQVSETKEGDTISTDINEFVRYKGFDLNGNILTMNASINAWITYGFDIPTRKDNIVTFKIIPLKPNVDNKLFHVGLSLGTKGVLSTFGHLHPGYYMNGFMWHPNGYGYSGSGSTFGLIGYYSIGQSICMKVIHNQTIEFYVEDTLTKSLKISETKIKEGTTLYPGVSVHGKGHSVKILEYSSKSN